MVNLRLLVTDFLLLIVLQSAKQGLGQAVYRLVHQVSGRLDQGQADLLVLVPLLGSESLN